MTNQDRLVPLAEVAERIGVSKRSLYRLVQEGSLPKPIKDRGRSRLFESEIERYLERFRGR